MNRPILSYYIFNNETISTANLQNFNNSHNEIIIYEVIRIIDGKPLFFEDHISRFFLSLKNYELENSITSETLITHINKLIEINQVVTGNCKFFIRVSPHTSPEFFAFIIPHSYPSANNYLRGVKLTSIIAGRNNPLS